MLKGFFSAMEFTLEQGLIEKWSTLDPPKIDAIIFLKLVFLNSLYPEFFEKK